LRLRKVLRQAALVVGAHRALEQLVGHLTAVLATSARSRSSASLTCWSS